MFGKITFFIHSWAVYLLSYKVSFWLLLKSNHSGINLGNVIYLLWEQIIMFNLSEFAGISLAEFVLFDFLKIPWR